MTLFDRTAQLWPILVMAARSQQILSYTIIQKLTGLPRQGVGDYLAPIQQYCIDNDLPPLTVLVISEKDGLPKDGFTEARNEAGVTVGETVFCQQSRCFVYDWFSIEKTPQSGDFETAFKNKKA